MKRSVRPKASFHLTWKEILLVTFFIPKDALLSPGHDFPWEFYG